jgi:hypothetical protein
MNIYIDSNTILSQFLPKDKFRQLNQLLFRQPEINWISGFISVIEVKTVLGRNWRENKLKIEPAFEKILTKFSESIQIQRLTEYCLQTLPIQIISICMQENLVLNKIEYDTDVNFNLAYRMSAVLNLRTLDLIQIAAAMNIKLYHNISIDYFLTNDQLILDNTPKILQSTKIIPISSQDLVNLLKIS